MGTVNLESILSLILVAALLVYLTYALLRPEKF
jgi:K+-transporting ATPase KdpF subunit